MRIKFLWLSLVLLFAISCQKEIKNDALRSTEYQDRISANLGNNVHLYIPFSEVPEKVASIILDINSIGFEGTMSLPEDARSVIVEDDIVEMYDIDRKVYTYSFGVESEFQSLDNFYNVVISQFEDNSITEPVILQYEMTPDFETAFLNGEKTFKEYDGVITSYSLRDKKNDLVKSTECGGNSICSGTGGGAGIAAPSSGGSTGSNGGASTQHCFSYVISISCSGNDHSYGDERCNCGKSVDCVPARQGLRIECMEIELFDGSNCPSGAAGNIGINTPVLIHDNVGDVVENTTEQIQKIADLLGFSMSSSPWSPWRYFQLNSDIRTDASRVVGGCLKSDSEKANDLLDQLKNKSSFQQQEELRYLMHKATDADFTLTKQQYSELFDREKTFEECDLFNDLWNKIKEETADFIDQFPSTQEEWNDFAEIIREELFTLETLADLAIPGLADFKSAFNSYKNGNGWGAAWDMSMAIMDLFPVAKPIGFALGVAKKVKRSSKIITVYRGIKSSVPDNLWKGFKGTIRKNYKNPGKIFSSHHLANPKFKMLLDKFGGQQEFISQVYKNAYSQGKVNDLVEGVAKNIKFDVDGVLMEGRAIKLFDGSVRIDDFWALD